MNEQNQEYEKKKFWIMLAGYYQRTLENFVVQMYAEDCRDFTLEEIKWSFEQWRRGPKGSQMPMPMQLIELINPQPDISAEANEIAGRIREAISKFGYTQGQEARAYIGETGWSAVQGFGGWVALCESQDEPAKWAQIRELAKAKMIRAAQGRTDVVPGLGLPGVQDRLQIASQTNADQPESTQRLGSLVSDTLKGKSLE